MEVRSAEWLLAAEPRSVPRARGLIAHALVHLPAESLDLVLLLASELVTNAVLHGTGSAMGLHLGWDGDGVRVEVADRSPGMPAVQSVDREATGGRGMLLVDRLASDWGVLAHQDGPGKTVWFMLRS